MVSSSAVRLTSLLRALVQDARAAEGALGRAGLPSSTAAVLGVLAEHGRIRLGRLAELLGIDPSVASRHVAHAHQAGLVVREPDPLDRHQPGATSFGRLTVQGCVARPA